MLPEDKWLLLCLLNKKTGTTKLCFIGQKNYSMRTALLSSPKQIAEVCFSPSASISSAHGGPTSYCTFMLVATTTV